MREIAVYVLIIISLYSCKVADENILITIKESRINNFGQYSNKVELQNNYNERFYVLTSADTILKIEYLSYYFDGRKYENYRDNFTYDTLFVKPRHNDFFIIYSRHSLEHCDSVVIELKGHEHKRYMLKCIRAPR